MFNSKLLVITRWLSHSYPIQSLSNPMKNHHENPMVNPIHIPFNHRAPPLSLLKQPLKMVKIPLNHYKIPLNHYKIPFVLVETAVKNAANPQANRHVAGCPGSGTLSGLGGGGGGGFSGVACHGAMWCHVVPDSWLSWLRSMGISGS